MSSVVNLCFCSHLNPPEIYLQPIAVNFGLFLTSKSTFKTRKDNTKLVIYFTSHIAPKRTFEKPNLTRNLLDASWEQCRIPLMTTTCDYDKHSMICHIVNLVGQLFCELKEHPDCSLRGVDLTTADRSLRLLLSVVKSTSTRLLQDPSWLWNKKWQFKRSQLGL